MSSLNKYLKSFIDFHEGLLNRIIHIVGFALIGVGIAEKSLLFVAVGGITQELGHFYQYAKTKKAKDNPLNGLKSQSLFAIPLFILIVLYIVLTK